jgi:hypothetical protein
MELKQSYKNFNRFYPLIALLLFFAFIPLALSGCGGGGGGSGSSSSTPSSTVSGTVNGGLSPISGATVNLCEANNPTISPNCPEGGTYLGTATTTATGSFSIPYVPPSINSLLYISAQGGNAGNAGKGVNAKISLFAPIGQSNKLPATNVVNELTTVTGLEVFKGSTSLINSNYGMNVFNNYTNLINPSTGNAASTGNANIMETYSVVANALANCVQETPGTGNCSTIATDVSDTTTAANTLDMVNHLISVQGTSTTSSTVMGNLYKDMTNTGWTAPTSAPLSITTVPNGPAGIYSGQITINSAASTFTLTLNSDGQFSYNDSFGDTSSGTYTFTPPTAGSTTGTITINSGSELCMPTSSTSNCQNGGGKDYPIPGTISGTYNGSAFTLVFPAAWTVSLNSNGVPTSISGTETINGTSAPITLNLQVPPALSTSTATLSDLAGTSFTNNFNPALSGTITDGYIPMTYNGNTVEMPVIPYSEDATNGTFSSTYNPDGSINFSGTTVQGSNTISFTGTVNSYGSPYFGKFTMTAVYPSGLCGGATVNSTGTFVIFNSGGINYAVSENEPAVSSPGGCDFGPFGELFQSSY